MTEIRSSIGLTLAGVLVALGPGLNGCKSEAPPTPGPTATGDTPVDGRLEPKGPAYRKFPDLATAAKQILTESRPRILGVGEFHVLAGAPPVLSTMERFTIDIATLTEGASDLIVETWVQQGTCGKKEQTVGRDVEQTLERPPEVENHLVRMLKSAEKRGVLPHVMTMTCADYDQLVDDKGAVNYDKMLVLVKGKLAGLARKVFDYRARPRKNDSQESQSAPAADATEPMIVMYGGALHNDEYPFAGLEDISYVKDVHALVGERYVELDLYVPEYVEGNALAEQETWYPVFERHASADHVLVFQRGPRSYLVILRRARTGDSPPTN